MKRLFSKALLRLAWCGAEAKANRVGLRVHALAAVSQGIIPELALDARLRTHGRVQPTIPGARS